jgi:hypothetical protein
MSIEAELLAKIASLEAANQALRVENQLLREKVDLLVRKLFGRSKEDVDASQLDLPGGTEPGKVPPPACNRRGTAHHHAVPLL